MRVDVVHHESTGGRAWRSRQAVPVVVAIVGSRLVVLAAAVLAEALPGRNAALTSGDGGPILRSLTSWDGWWYLGLARDGYHVAPLVDGYHDYAFLPLYPLLVRVLSLPWPELAGLVAVVLSNVLFVVALALLVRLGETVLPERFPGDDRAGRGVALLAIAPFGAAFSMAYSESLFLALSVGAFLAAERDRRAWAGILLALASLTRLQGAFLVLPIWLILFVRDGRRVRASQAWLLLGPLAALAFLGYVAALTGDLGAYGAAQAAWGRGGIGGVGGGGVGGGGGGASGPPIGSALDLNQLVLVVTLVVPLFLLVFRRVDGVPWAYAAVPLLYTGAVVASGILESVGRYVTLAFPNAWLLAARRARWFRVGWPVVSVVLLGVLSAQMFRGYFVP